MAYDVALSGSDWKTIYFRTVEDSKQLDDKVEWVKFSGISWTPDEKGVFYSRYAKPVDIADNDSEEKRGSETQAVLGHQLYYHRIGTPQSEDVLVYDSPENPKWLINGQVTDDGEYLLISISQSTDNVNRLYYASLKGVDSKDFGSLNVVKLIDNEEAEWSYVCNDASQFWFKTNLDAPRGRVMRIDFASPAQDKWVEILPHSEDVLSHIVSFFFLFSFFFISFCFVVMHIFFLSFLLFFFLWKQPPLKPPTPLVTT